MCRLQELTSLRAQVAKLTAEAAAMEAAARVREKMDEVELDGLLLLCICSYV